MKQVFCWMILLQIINLSIHPLHLLHPRLTALDKAKASPINECNSLYEFIAEGVFHQDVPETDDDEIDVSSPPFELYFSAVCSSQLPAMDVSIKHVPRYKKNTLLVYKEPHSPPPKQLG